MWYDLPMQHRERMLGALWRPAAQAAVLALAYLGFGYLSIGIQSAHDLVTLVPFLPEGIAFAAVLLLGRTMLAGIFLGQLALALVTGAGLEAGLVIASGNTLASGVGAWVLMRLGFDRRLERFRDSVLLLLVCVLVCQPLSASMGHLGLWLGGRIVPEAIPLSWFHWWSGNIVVQWILVPLLLRLWSNPWAALRQPLPKTMGFVGATVALAVVAFARIPWLEQYQHDLRWLFVPLLMVCAAVMGTDLALGLAFLYLLLLHAILWLGLSALDAEHLAQMFLYLDLLILASSLCASYIGSINRQLVVERERAQEAGEIRTRFLASMSHEIRTPLNGMLGLVQILQRSGVRGQERQQVEEIGRAGRSLLSLLNNILDLSKVEAGEFRPQREEFLLDAVLEDTASTCLASLRNKGLDFWISCAPGVPLVCHGDPVRLQQILVNLVGNAAKFTERGSVRIEVTASEGPEGRLCFEVIDTGMGMEPQVVRHIFEPYHQGDHSISNRFGGTGLGLTLSREIARLLGGDLQVKTEAGNGSHFQLTLPLVRTSGLPELPERAGTFGIDLEDPSLREGIEWTARRRGWEIVPYSQAQVRLSKAGGTGQIQLGSSQECPGGVALPWPFTPLRLQNALQEFRFGTTAILIPVVRPVLAGRRILLVEDEPVNRLVARQILEQSGAQVEEAADGLDALEIIAGNAFDTVLMDLHMPRMGGVEAARRLRAQAPASLRILALTAGSTEEERLECQQAGMDGFLTKPFDADELIRTLVALGAT